MSIHVNDFKHEPGKNDTKYIALLEKTLKQEQAVTAKAVAKVRKQTKEIENIRNKTIDEFANAIKTNYDMNCRNKYCSDCLKVFKEQIDKLSAELKNKRY